MTKMARITKPLTNREVKQKIPIFIDMKDWLLMEFKPLDLGDKRNNERTLEIVSNISKAP